MEYQKIEDLKVTCIADESDFELFGVTMEDIFQRTPEGFSFLRKIKELAGSNQKVEWTNCAYTLQMNVLPDKRLAITFSETIADYLISLEQSKKMMTGENQEALDKLIQAITEADETEARNIVKLFEQNVRSYRA